MGDIRGTDETEYKSPYGKKTTQSDQANSIKNGKRLLLNLLLDPSSIKEFNAHKV